MGALEYLDENSKTIFIEDWKSILQKYVDYCEKTIVDITYPKDKVPDIHFHNKNKNELELVD